MSRLTFYLFPFFVTNLIKRYKTQFESNDDRSWEYLPEHISNSYILTEKEYSAYINRFINRLILNAVIGFILLFSIVFWILFVRVDMTYFMYGLAILLIYYHGAYFAVYQAFYNLEKKHNYYGIIGFLFPTLFALILIANYFDWSLEREDLNAFLKTISNTIGLTPFIKQYPYISFGIFFGFFFALRMFYGVFSAQFRPVSKRRRRQIKEERNAPPKEKPWDKALREAKEKEKLSKKEKKKRKKKKKKEMKKQGKVFPKKYKGDTE